MSRSAGLAALFVTLLLGACAAPLPPGPSVMALPAQGKSFEAFQQDDGVCRQFAAAQIGNASPGAAANQSFTLSAAAGTVLGAATGALIGAATGGAGAGAAIGAASGLLLGTANGAGAARYSGAALQARYDMAYLQCMSAKGENVPVSVGRWAYPHLNAYTYVYPYGYPFGYLYPQYYPYRGYP